jgi:multiple sugar transport system permease protein
MSSSRDIGRPPIVGTPSWPLRFKIRRGDGHSRSTGAIWLFLLPFLAGLVIFLLLPLIASAVLIFYRYDALSDPQFVGLANLQRMLRSSSFWQSWEITLIYGGAGIFLTTVLSFVIALALYHAKAASSFWKVVYYLPALLGGTAEALILWAVWNPSGMINSLLSLFGIAGPGWLQDSRSALAALILARYWTIGNAVLFFLGGRATVPPSLYEVARIDGASRWQTVRFITVPLMSPVILFVVALGLIAGLQSFTQVYILTAGGPAGATHTIGIYIYEVAFRDLEFGYASAVSWTLFVVTLLVTLGLLLMARRWVYYEAGRGGI